MRWVVSFALGAVATPVLVCLAGFVYLKIGAHGFSARAEPMEIEKFAALQARLMALPAEAKKKQDPGPSSQSRIGEGLEHWADHCAICHANDGSGQTEIGRSLYPPAPDMRKRETQEMTDGELFYVIENGVRLSGMPAWGTNSHKDQDSSWKLVRFIRRLPNLSSEEISKMEKLNPKTPDELQEEQQEQQFLKGQPSNPLRSTDQHH